MRPLSVCSGFISKILTHNILPVIYSQKCWILEVKRIRFQREFGFIEYKTTWGMKNVTRYNNMIRILFEISLKAGNCNGFHFRYYKSNILLASDGETLIVCLWSPISWNGCPITFFMGTETFFVFLLCNTYPQLFQSNNPP